MSFLPSKAVSWRGPHMDLHYARAPLSQGLVNRDNMSDPNG